MQSFASSIVASLVLSVLLFTNPASAQCNKVLTALGSTGADYVSALGSGANCGGGQATLTDCKTGTSTANKFCATPCTPGIATTDALGAGGGTVGENVVETAFTTTTTNKYASAPGVAGTILHGQCGGSPVDVTFTAFTTTQANKYASTAGKVGTVSAAGVLGTGAALPADVQFTAFTTTQANKYASTAGKVGTVTAAGALGAGAAAPADVQFTAFTTTSANKYASTAGKVGTVSAAGVLGTGADLPADVVFTAFTQTPPTGKFAKTAGKVGTVTAGGVLGTGTSLPSDVIFETCTVCDSCQTTTTACVVGAANAAGALTTQGVNTVCGGTACTPAPTPAPTPAASGAAGVTVSMAACGLAAVAAALRT